MGVLCNCVQKADLDVPMHGIQAIFSVCSYHKYVIVTLPWLKKKKKEKKSTITFPPGTG